MANTVRIKRSTGSSAPTSLANAELAFAATGTSLNDSNKVNNSVVYFDSSSGTFKADQTRTVENLVDGGNF